MFKKPLALSAIFLSFHPFSAQAEDRAAFERSIADLAQAVNVKAHPNPIAYLGSAGAFYCRLKAAKGGGRLDIQAASTALRKSADMAPTTADEAMGTDAAMSEAGKYLCPD